MSPVKAVRLAPSDPPPSHPLAQEHYFWMMQPWVHYVPVSTRFEDLVDVVHWLQQHDDVAQAIGRAGREFAAEHLSRANLLAFHREILLQYAARYDPSHGGDGGWPSGACPAVGKVRRPALDYPEEQHRPARLPLCNRAPRSL